MKRIPARRKKLPPRRHSRPVTVKPRQIDIISLHVNLVRIKGERRQPGTGVGSGLPAESGASSNKRCSKFPSSIISANCCEINI
jgi:hypothetical protein